MVRRLVPVVLFLALSAPAVSAALRGSVTRSDGQPSAHATVQVYAPETETEKTARLHAAQDRKPLASATTADDGSFSISDKLPSIVDVIATADGLAPSARRVRNGEDAVMSMTTAKTIKGMVVCGGKPAGGAFVVATAQDDLNAAPASITARAAADGSFSIPDPAAWADMISVVHPSCAPLLYTSQRGIRTAVTRLEMENGIDIHGRTTLDGKPLAAATIYADGWEIAKSGEDGTFRASHAPPHFTLLTAVSGDLAGAWKFGSGAVEIALEPSHVLRGTVVDSKNHAPVDGAYVQLYDEEAGQVMGAAFSTPNGKYEVRTLPGRKVNLMAAAAGYSFGEQDARSVDLHKARAIERNIELTKLPTISGRIVDEQNHPVGGALVSLWLAGGPAMYVYGYRHDPPFGVAMYSRPDGSFMLVMSTMMPTDEMSMAVLAVSKGFAAARSQTIRPQDVRDGGVKNVVVKLSHGRELRGIVTDASGTPLSGVSVAVVEEGTYAGYQMPLEQVVGNGMADLPQTDAHGGFALQVNDIGHMIGFSRHGFAFTTAKHVRPGGEPLKVVLDPGATLRGRVIYEDGTPMPDVIAFLARGDGRTGGTSTGADGSFAVEDVRPGTYQLQLYKRDESFSDVRTITIPSDDIVVRVPVGGSVRGHVIDASTRQPIPAFAVSLEPVNEDAGDSASYLLNRNETIQNVDGAFEISHVHAGEMTATIQAEGYRSKKVGTLSIADKSTREVDVELDRGVTIEGRVRSADGDPLENVAVSATSDHSDDENAVSAETDSEGHYSISGLAAGRWKFTFVHDDYLQKDVIVDITATPSHVDATLSRGNVLRGTVSSGSSLVENAWVRAYGASDYQSHSAQTDANGKYELSGLGTQVYSVSAGKDGVGEAEVESVEVANTPQLDLHLEKQPVGTVMGHVNGLPEGELPMRMVIARNENGKMARSAIDEAGNYKIESAPTGHLTVVASISTENGTTRSSRPKAIDLGEGETSQVDLEFRNDITIHGTVVRDDQPVFNAYVSFSGEGNDLSVGAKTDEAGKYEVVGIEPGEYTVTASASMVGGYTTSYVVTESAQFDIDMTGAKLRGTVIDETTEAAVDGASVSLWSTKEGSGSHPVFDATTDSNGTFVRSAIAEGTYRVLAQKDGYAQEMQEVTLSRGSMSEVLLRMRPAGGIRVAVVDGRDGKTLDAISIVRDTDRQIVANQHSSPNSDGSVTISLADGSYLLSVSSSGYGSVTLPVTSPSPTLRVALTPGGTLVIRSKRELRGRVHLVDPSGEEYVQCWCNGIADIRLHGQETRIEHITPNTYAVELIDELGVPRQAGSVTIVEGREAVLETE